MNQLDLPPTANVDTPGDLDQLEVRLQGKLGGRIRHLRVLLGDCGLILRGFARTYHAKQVAQHAVMTETSLPILANEIEVC